MKKLIYIVVTSSLFAATYALANIAETSAKISNPYGIDALWQQGDMVAKATLVILLLMSLGTWYIGIMKLIEQSRLFNQSRERV